MAKSITPIYSNNREYIYNLGQQSELFNAEDFNNTEDQDSYMQMLASVYGQTPTNYFDKDVYETFYDVDIKMSYLMDSYYGDPSDKDWIARQEAYSEQLVWDREHRAYDAMSGFEKVLSNIFLTPIIGIFSGGSSLLGGVFNVGKTVAGEIAGNIASIDDLTEEELNEILAEKNYTSIDQITDYDVYAYVRTKTTTSNDIFTSFQDWLYHKYYRYTAVGKDGFWGDVVGVYKDVVENLTKMSVMFIPYVGKPIYFASMAGNTAREAVEENPDINTVNLMLYTSAVLGVEIGTEYLFGDVFFGEGFFDPAKIALNIKNPLAQALAYYGIHGLSEACEEMAAEILDWGLKKLFVDGDATITVEQVLYAGLIGGLTGYISTSAAVNRTTSINGLTKIDTYETLQALQKNSNNLNELIKENSEVFKLKVKYSNETETEIAQNHSSEYNAAKQADKQVNENISKYLLLVAEAGNHLGVEGVAKADEILQKSIQERADYARYQAAYDADSNIRANKYAQLYNKYNKDGSSFTPKETLTDTEFNILKGLKKIFPDKTIVFGNVGGNRSTWSGATIHENVIFINSNDVSRLSLNTITNKIISHEIVHTFQRVNGILNKSNMDFLDTLIHDLYDINIDYDSIDLPRDNAINDDPLMSRAEKQAVFYSQQLLYNQNFVDAVYKSNPKLIKQVYKFLKNFAKNQSVKSEKGRLKFAEVNMIMAMYRATLIKNVTNETDANAVMNEFELTEEQRDKFTASYIIRDMLSDHMCFTKARLNMRTATVKETMDLLFDNFKDQRNFEYGTSDLGDPNNYTEEFLQQIGYSKGSDFVDVLNDYLEPKDLLYHKPTNSFITRFNFKEYISDAFLSDITKKITNTIKAKDVFETSFDGLFYDDYNYDILIAYMDDTVDYLNDNYNKIDKIFDQSIFNILHKTQSDLYTIRYEMSEKRDYMTDARVEGSGQTVHNKNTIEINLIGILNTWYSLSSTNKDVQENLKSGKKTKNDFLTFLESSINNELVTSLDHEITHAIAYTEGLYLGASPSFYESLLFDVDQKTRDTLKNKLVKILGDEELADYNLSDILYELTGGEENAEVYDKKSWGSFKGDTYINIRYVDGKYEISFSSNLKFLQPYLKTKNENIEFVQESRRARTKRDVKISEFLNKNNLKSEQDMVDFGFTSEFADVYKNGTMYEVSDLIYANNIANKNSENYEEILNFVVQNVLTNTEINSATKAFKDYLTNNLPKNSQQFVKQINEMQLSNEQILQGLSIKYSQNTEFRNKKSSKQISLESFNDNIAEDVDSFEISERIKARRYSEILNSENRSKEMAQLIKDSGLDIKTFLRTFYKDLKNLTEYLSQRELDLAVNFVNNLYKKQGIETRVNRLISEQTENVSEENINTLEKSVNDTETINKLKNDLSYNKSLTDNTVSETKQETVDIDENVTQENVSRETIKQTVEEPVIEKPKIDTNKQKRLAKIKKDIGELAKKVTQSEYHGESNENIGYYTISLKDIENNRKTFEQISENDLFDVVNELSTPILDDADADNKRIAIRSAIVQWAYSQRNSLYKNSKSKIQALYESEARAGAIRLGQANATWGDVHTVKGNTQAMSEELGTKISVDEKFVTENVLHNQTIEDYKNTLYTDLETLHKNKQQENDPYKKMELEYQINSLEAMIDCIEDDDFDGFVDEYLRHQSDILSPSEAAVKSAEVYKALTDYLAEKYKLVKKMDENTTTKLDKFKKLKKVTRQLKNYRYIAMLSSPTTWGKNAVNNILIGTQALIEDMVGSKIEKSAKIHEKSEAKFHGDYGKDFKNYIVDEYSSKILNDMEGSKYADTTRETQFKDYAKEQVENSKHKITTKLKKIEQKGLSDTPYTTRRAVRAFTDTLAGTQELIRHEISLTLKARYKVSQLKEQDIIKTVKKTNPELAKRLELVYSRNGDESLIETVKLSKDLHLTIVDDIYTESLTRADELFFKSKNWWSNTVKNLRKNHPAAAEILEAIIPFGRVTVNTFNYLLNRSPVGLAKGIYKMLKSTANINTEIKNYIIEYYKNQYIEMSKKNNEAFKYDENTFKDWCENNLNEQINKAMKGDKKALYEVGEEMINEGKIQPGRDDMFGRAKASELIAQGAVGTTKFVAGVLIGLLTDIFYYDDDDDYFGAVLKIGNFKVKLSDIAPFNTSFVLGAMLGSGNVDDKLEVLFEIMVDQSIFSTFDSAITYSDNLFDFLGNQTINYIQSYIPAITKRLAKLSNVKYDKSGNFFDKLWKTTFSNLWFAQHLVPKKVNPYTGDYQAVYDSGIFESVFNIISPISFRIDNDSVLEKEAKRLGVTTSGSGYTISINGTKYSVVGNTQYAKDRANYINSELTALIQSTKYKKMSDEEKQAAIRTIYRNATELAKINLWTTGKNNYRVFTSSDEYQKYKKYLTNPSNIRQRYSNFSGSKYLTK